jgi:hypothetical protein
MAGRSAGCIRVEGAGTGPLSCVRSMDVGTTWSGGLLPGTWGRTLELKRTGTLRAGGSKVTSSMERLRA